MLKYSPPPSGSVRFPWIAAGRQRDQSINLHIRTTSSTYLHKTANVLTDDGLYIHKGLALLSESQWPGKKKRGRGLYIGYTETMFYWSSERFCCGFSPFTSNKFPRRTKKKAMMMKAAFRSSYFLFNRFFSTMNIDYWLCTAVTSSFYTIFTFVLLFFVGPSVGHGRLEMSTTKSFNRFSCIFHMRDNIRLQQIW